MNPTKSLRDVLGLAMLALVVACLVTAAQAQDAGVQSGAGTGQPARAVRLSYVDGKVRLAQGDQVLADQAVVNTPLLEGMQLTTGDDGKAEIQFEDGSVARISPDSSLTLAALRGSGATGDAEMALNSGLAYFELQGGDQAGQLSVHFGPGVITTSGFTVLRVAMDNAPGEVAVFSGNAHLEGNNGAIAIDLHGGEGVALSATDPSGYNLAESIEPNSWDAWNSDRDQVLTTEAAAQTGAPANMGQSENPAWNDLDANGSWYNVPGQGYIWSPYDAANAGFDPYGVGNWMWTPGFGYIWASGYPWGYMPFQCGAWNFYNDFGWGWAPGMSGCRPWWGLGFYGGANLGYVPPGYHVIARPIVPRNPVRGRPLPMVAVNHNEPVMHAALPARNGSSPVVIAGTSVRALAPLPARTEYAHPTMIVGTAHVSAAAQPANGQTAGARPGYTRPAGWNPAEGAQNSAAAEHGSNSATVGRTNSAPANQPSNSGSRPVSGNGGGAPHPSASSSSAGASHPSGGGSSGGGGFSGGGGSGGGGGSHGGGGRH